jgi:hypothetical protein
MFSELLEPEECLRPARVGITSAGAVKPRDRLGMRSEAPIGATQSTSSALCRPCRGFVGFRDCDRGLTAPAKAVSAHSGLFFKGRLDDGTSYEPWPGKIISRNAEGIS